MPQTVGHGFIGTENTEVLLFPVQTENIPHIAAQLNHILGFHSTGSRDLHCVIPEIRQTQTLEQQSAVGMGVGAHATDALRSQRLKLWNQPPGFIEQLLRVIAAQPLLQNCQMLRLIHGNRHLMGMEAALNLYAVHFLWTGPALGRAEDDHGPTGTLGAALFSGSFLNGTDFFDDSIQNGSHFFVHFHGIGALYKIGVPAAALKEALNLFVGDAGEYRGIADLKAVEVENRQHSAISYGIQKLVAVPGGCQRTGFCLAIAYHAGCNQVRIVKHRAKGMRQRIAQFAAFVDGTGGFGCNMAGNAAREGELLEQPLHALDIPAHIGINLAVGALQVRLRYHGVSAMTGTGEIDHIQVIFFNDTVEMRIDEILTGYGAPMPDNFTLDVFRLQRFPQKGIVQQIKLTGCQIVGCPPPGVEIVQFLFIQYGMLCMHRYLLIVCDV